MNYRPEDIRDSETGTWINSQVFREEVLKFKRLGYYCADPKGTLSHKEYWDEQLKRCKEGYSVAGHKITNHHYQYLNFSEIEIVDENDKKKTGRKRRSRIAKKETRPPDFWDGDYDYYWCLEIARNGLFNDESLATSELEKDIYDTLDLESQKAEKQRVLQRLKLRVKPHPDYLDGGYHLCVGKSRRKGYSYKNGAICVNVYNTIRKSLTIIGAFDKKYLYPKGTMGMASAYMDYLNKHTAFAKGREKVNLQEHKRASFVENINGVLIESGYMSEVMAISFQDNPEAARGKDAQYVLFEEAGVFPNLEDSFTATAPGLTAGSFITGQIIIFGTGGDMESGTIDFSKMFYEPFMYGLMPFENIWDENAEGTYCGFFHPVYWNMEGYYDEQGNSDVEGAKAYEMEIRRKLVENSKSARSLQGRVQEYPMSPSEAFLTVSMNDFPVVELRRRLNKVLSHKLHIKEGTPVTLEKYSQVIEKITKVDEEGNLVEEEVTRDRVRAVPDLTDPPLLEPLWTYKPKTSNTNGAVIIYEGPVANPPKGLYKIGYDPYRHDEAVDSVSLAAIYVYKAHHKFSDKKHEIVAQYVGRPETAAEVNKIAELLAEFYNTEVMFENEVTHTRDHFITKKKTHLMALQPDTVITNNTDNSKVKRTWGCHMTDKLKDAGEKYIKEWLLEVRNFDESGNKVLNLDTLDDPALIEELILYNRKGNFDRVMAFMMVMFQIKEEEESKEYGDNPYNKSTADELLELMERQFKNNN